MEKVSIDGRIIPTINGGHGSGNFGHSGRPGKVGGSGKGNVSTITKGEQIKAQHEAGLITDSERDELIAQAKSDGTLDKEITPLEQHTSAPRGKQSKKTQESATEWMKKHLAFPEDAARLQGDFSFDETLARMADGEQFYDFFGSIDSADREQVFTELSKRTGLEYDAIYESWLGHPTKEARDYRDDLIRSPRLRQIRKAEYGTKNYDEARLRDMVHSVWAYGGDKGDNKYLTASDKYTRLSPSEKKKVIDDEWGYLDKHCTTKPAGEDSEGVGYVSVKYRPSEKKKK